MCIARAQRLIRFTVNQTTAVSFSSSIHQQVYLINTKITSCFNRGNFISAQKLFDEMPQRNVVTYNCMVSGFARNRMISEARNLFDLIPERNLVSWTAIVSGYIGCGDLDEARKLFDRIPGRIKNVVCWDVMLNGYLRNGRTEEAKKLFDEAPGKSIGLCNRMLSGYVEKGMLDEAHELFSSMPRRDIVSWTTMIACFSRAGFMERAKRMFDEIPFEKDVKVWTTIIRGYMQNGNVEEACRLFGSMPARDIDAVAWNSMVSGFVRNGRLKEAIDVYRKMPTKNVVASNSLLYGLVQTGKIVEAIDLFRNDMIHKDAASWNTLISGYQTEEALVLFIRMLNDGFRPDQATYTTLIPICSDLGFYSWGKAIHSSVIKNGYEHNTKVGSSLMSMYSKCGLITDANILFKNMKERDTVAWNTMILAQSHHGSAEMAMRMFGSMIEAKCEPNHVTFLAILTSCAHSGLVEDGKRYFRSMQEDWKIAPRPEHLACMVDLLSRSGLLNEAYELVKGLPVNLPAYILEALLSCCKIHGNVEIGEAVARRILDSDPLNVDMYVLLSNIYAAKGLWREAADVRELIKCRDFRKELGCSWIEFGRRGDLSSE